MLPQRGSPAQRVPADYDAPMSAIGRHEPHDEHPDHEHDHGHDHGDHAHDELEEEDGHRGAGHVHGQISGGPGALRVVGVGSLGLAIVAAVELSVAAVSGSAAVLADGLHNLGDVFTTVALAVAFMLSRRAPSRRFPYGYHRGEDLAGLAVLLLIVASAAASGVAAIEHLLHEQGVSHLPYAIGAALVGFVGNELVAQYKIHAGNRLGSVALVADGKHSRVDGLASLGALAGLIGASLGAPVLDPVAGLVITVAIVAVAWDTARNVGGRLLDAADESLVDEIAGVTKEIEGVLGVDDVRARWTGRRLWVELTLRVDPSETVGRAHALGEEARHLLHHRLESLAGVSVHLDPDDGEAHALMEHHRSA